MPSRRAFGNWERWALPARAVGWGLMPPRQRLSTAAPLPPARPGGAQRLGQDRGRRQRHGHARQVRDGPGRAIPRCRCCWPRSWMPTGRRCASKQSPHRQASTTTSPRSGRACRSTPTMTARSSAGRLADGQGHARNRRHGDRRLVQHQGPVAADARGRRVARARCWSAPRPAMEAAARPRCTARRPRAARLGQERRLRRTRGARGLTSRCPQTWRSRTRQSSN